MGALSATLALAALLVYTPTVREGTLSVTLQSVVADVGSTRIQVRIQHGSADQDLRLVAFPVASRVQPSLLVFDDPRYPTANVGPTVARGIFAHLQAELRIHEYAQPVTAVNAEGLKDLFKATSKANGRAVVIMTGALPEEVLSRDVNLVTPWVNAGGLVIWGGGTIGYWAARQDRPLSRDESPLSLLEKGPALLLGGGVVDFPSVNQRIAKQPTPLGSALGIGYEFASDGVDWPAAVRLGGKILGSTAGPFSSVTYIPQAKGGFLIFGGEVPDEASVSSDLTRLILSGVMGAAGPAAAKEIHLADIPRNAVDSWILPFTAGTSQLMVLAFDPNPDSRFYFARVLRT